jgi:hypothetical protein
VRLERAESLLLRPSALSAGHLIEELEDCCRLLAVAEEWARSEPDPAWGEAAMEWRRSLSRLEQLTAGAASFCQGWAVAAGLAGGYTVAGTGDLPPGIGPRMERTG